MTDIVRSIFGINLHYVKTGRLRALYIRRGDKLLWTIRRWNFQRARWDVAAAPKRSRLSESVTTNRQDLAVSSTAPGHDILREAMVNADRAEATA